MKTRVVGLIMLVVMCSCSEHFCPTYSGAKGYSDHRVAAKKVKPSKGKVAATKSMRFAETD